MELGLLAKSKTAWQSRTVMTGLCASNLVLLIMTIILGVKLYSVDDCKDPSLSVWCKISIGLFNLPY